MHTTKPLRAVLALAAALAAALAITACTAAPGPERSPSGSGSSAGEVIASGLDAPWSIAFHGGIPLVSERDSARILELDAQGEAREVAVIAGVRPAGEGGLLGIAVRDGFLYVSFTSDDDHRIDRFPITGESGSLSLGERERVIDGIPSASNHNGGRLAFGPDGMLYATTGDANEPASAQDRDSLAGKILRMTPDGDVPGDNPYAGSYVYSYGHRNPQGIAWDSAGTMYASEFGQNTWDELNIIEAGGNYGWPEVEGFAGEDGMVDPVQQWEPADASPSGMAITDGSIWIANLRGERLREIPLSDLADSTEHWAGEHGRLRDVVAPPGSGLWVVTNNTDGRGDPRVDDDRILRFTAR